MVEADFMEFIRGNFVIKMRHPIPIPRYFPHQLCFVFVQDFFIQEASGDFLVLRGGKSKPFSQDVTTDIKEGLKRSSQVRLGGSDAGGRAARRSFPKSMPLAASRLSDRYL